jgi:hypothetical protein
VNLETAIDRLASQPEMHNFNGSCDIVVMRPGERVCFSQRIVCRDPDSHDAASTLCAVQTFCRAAASNRAHSARMRSCAVPAAVTAKKVSNLT